MNTQFKCSHISILSQCLYQGFMGKNLANVFFFKCVQVKVTVKVLINHRLKKKRKLQTGEFKINYNPFLLPMFTLLRRSNVKTEARFLFPLKRSGRAPCFCDTDNQFTSLLYTTRKWKLCYISNSNVRPPVQLSLLSQGWNMSRNLHRPLHLSPLCLLSRTRSLLAEALVLKFSALYSRPSLFLKASAALQLLDFCTVPVLGSKWVATLECRCMVHGRWCPCR